MQRSAFQHVAIAMLVMGLGACADEGVGDPCIPEKVPCDETECGYTQSESFIESSSVQCRTRFCIVHEIKGKSSTHRADPTKRCADPEFKDDPTCVPDSALDESVYCTCRCDGPKTSVEFCDCPGGFSCEPVLNLGGDGIKGSYCIRK